MRPNVGDDDHGSPFLGIVVALIALASFIAGLIVSNLAHWIAT
jgi:hypothetical protein